MSCTSIGEIRFITDGFHGSIYLVTQEIFYGIKE